MIREARKERGNKAAAEGNGEEKDQEKEETIEMQNTMLLPLLLISLSELEKEMRGTEEKRGSQEDDE